jgi:acetyltransferase-like isoleucine patch superfamily enzyme
MMNSLGRKIQEGGRMKNEHDLEADFIRRSLEFRPWQYFEAATEEQKLEQKYLQAVLARRANATINGNCYIAPSAAVFTDMLEMDDKSFIAAGAIVRNVVRIGRESCIGSYAHIAGNVVIGSNTMIAGGVAIYGFNHGTDPTYPMGYQPCTVKGITIGSDCWIGANAVIIDGVNIGDHSIVAAGAIVTKSFPPFSIVGGNPARLIRDRSQPKPIVEAALPQPLPAADLIVEVTS